MQQLRSLSHIARLAAQRELIHRPLNEPAYQQLASIVADPTLPLECRVAALFTFTLSARAQSIDQVMKWTADPILAEYALRAVADYASSLKPDDEAARATIPMAAIARLATSFHPFPHRYYSGSNGDHPLSHGRGSGRRPYRASSPGGIAGSGCLSERAAQ
jgi:hypothetical protein